MGAGAGGKTGQTGGQGGSSSGGSSPLIGGQAQGQNIQYGLGASGGYYGDRGGGAAGDSYGGQSQGQGGAGQAGAGYGEEGQVMFRYEIYDDGGFVSQSGFDYSTLEDARDAGLAVAVYPQYVMVVADKVGFTGSNSRYDTQPPDLSKPPATGQDGASGDDLGAPPGTESNWMVILIVAIVIIAILAFGLKGGS